MSRDRLHVVIAGGGVAAVETLLALRELAGRRVEITLLSPERRVPLPPGHGRRGLRSRRSAQLRARRHRRLRGRRRDHLGSSREQSPRASALLHRRRHADPVRRPDVASGAIATEPLPGALTFRGRGDVAALRAVVDDLARRHRRVDRADAARRSGPGHCRSMSCADDRRVPPRARRDAEVWLVTPEEEPLELFGPAAGRAIERCCGLGK